MLVFLLLVGGTASASPNAPMMHADPPAAPSACQAETPRMRALVTRLLTSPALAPLRADHGLQGVRPNRVNSVTDRAACSALARAVHLSSGPYPQVTSYFYADGFYFVPVVYVVPPNRNFMGHDGLIVLDQNLHYVSSFAM
jgi:hypothetical protein